MAIYTIPVDGLQPSYTQTTDLSGVDFELRLDWAERAGAWRLDVRTLAGEAVALGLVLAPGVRLLRRVTSPLRPAGEIVCLAEGSRVGRDDFTAGTAELLYVDGDDLAGIATLI